MSTIFTRRAMEHWWGWRPLSVIAFAVRDHPGGSLRFKTWGEVHAERRERQARRLDAIRHVERPQAVRVWVAYFDQSFFGGWQAFVETIRGQVWIDWDARPLRVPLMRLYPMGLPFGDEREQWEDWKPAFARHFRKRTQDRHPVGIAYLWARGNTLALRPDA